MLNSYPYTTPTDRALAEAAERGVSRHIMSRWVKTAVARARELRAAAAEEATIADVFPRRRALAERLKGQASDAVWHARIAADAREGGDSSRCLLAAQSTGASQDVLFRDLS